MFLRTTTLAKFHRLYVFFFRITSRVFEGKEGLLFTLSPPSGSLPAAVRYRSRAVSLAPLGLASPPSRGA